jgi:alcohol dehydrogenase
MKAARMHAVGSPLIVEEIDTPAPRDGDVLVRVRACGIVPNLGNVLANWATWCPELPLPPLPAIFGLDPAGEIAEIGGGVHDFRVGDRVYVNPGRSCGSCRQCRLGRSVLCTCFTLNGYFGFSHKSLKIFERYPYGGLAQYMTAPATALVRLPSSVSFDQAARLGYIGTAYSALKKAMAGPQTRVLINGASGTLGLGCVVSALAMGVPKIFGTGRNPEWLERTKAIAPDRIETFSVSQGSIKNWIDEQTNGEGVEIAVDCLNPGASHQSFLEALRSLARGGVMVDAGGVAGDVPVDVLHLMTNGISLIGSPWFTTEEAQELASYATSGSLDLSIFEHERYDLDDINQAISATGVRSGGFTNFVVRPG